MLKMLKSLCVVLALFAALMTVPTKPAVAQETFLDRYAYNPFAVALAVAGAGVSVATAANAVTTAAAAVGGAAEVVIAGATVVGGATAATVVLTGVGIGVVLLVGTVELTDLFESAQGAALAFQGR